MGDEKKEKEILKKLARLAEEFRKAAKPDPRKYLQQTDALTREYYKVRHPELNR